jgi:hypothetical protein
MPQISLKYCGLFSTSPTKGRFYYFPLADRDEKGSLVTAEDLGDRTFSRLYLNVDPVPAKGALDFLQTRCGVRAEFLDPADVFDNPEAIIALVDSFRAVVRTKSLAAAWHRVIWNLGYLHFPTNAGSVSRAFVRWNDVLDNGQAPEDPAAAPPPADFYRRHRSRSSRSSTVTLPLRRRRSPSQSPPPPLDPAEDAAVIVIN